MIDPIIYALNYNHAHRPSIAFPDPTAWDEHTIDGISIDAPTSTAPGTPHAHGVQDFDSSAISSPPSPDGVRGIVPRAGS